MPTLTFPIATDTDDGSGEVSDVVWANAQNGTGTFSVPSGGRISAARSLNVGSYIILDGFMRWNTSTLPAGAVVTSATLDVYAIAKGDPESLILIGDWYEYGGSPATLADWANMASGSAITGVTLASLTTSAVNTLTLTNVGNVSLVGYTGIRLGVQQKTADAAPTGDNFVDFAGFEDAQQEARLNVTYSAVGDAVTAPVRRTFQ